MKTFRGSIRSRLGRLGRPLSRRVKSWLGSARILGTYGFAWLNRRLHGHVTVVGITGSAGKTTTKDLTAAILSDFGACQSTDRSANEPLPIARLVGGLRRSHRFCVVELSENAPGCLDLPLKIGRPNIAVLTLIGRDHYSAFRSIEAIARETGKLVSALDPDEVAVLNIDDPLIRKIGESSNRRVIWVGESRGATIRLVEARSVWPEPLTLSVAFEGVTRTVRTRLHGSHLALSVLAALGVAVALKLPLDRVIAVLEEVGPTEGRMQVVEADDGVTFVRDDWKAPHWSLQQPLDFLEAARASRKIAVVGTVSDSPKSPSRRYPAIAREVRKVADLAIFVGPDAFRALKARSSPDDASIQAFERLRGARDHLNGVLRPGDLVLLKGTNPSDHLVRLIIDRSTPVQCWRQDCRLTRFCDGCPWLHQGTEVSFSSACINPR